MAKLTEKEFLALPARKQDAPIIQALGIGAIGCGLPRCMGHYQYPDGRRLADTRQTCERMPAIPRFVGGDGNAFFEVFDSLPREDNERWGFHEGPLGVTVESNILGRADGFAEDRRVAVCVALLKVKGVVE